MGDFNTTELEVVYEEEGFCIDNDKTADWAVRKVKAEQEEYERLKEIAEAEIEDIRERLAAAEQRMKNRTAYLTGLLRVYFEDCPRKVTKTTEKYQLLSGCLVYTKPKQTIVQDETKLLEWLKESGRTEYIRTEEKAAWGEFKKTLCIVGEDVVVDETGEIVPCVEIVTKEGSFEVKP